MADYATVADITVLKRALSLDEQRRAAALITEVCNQIRYEAQKIGKNFDEMIKISETLASPFPFVRVDLYNINGTIYFSEMTFTPAKGTLILDDDNCDFEMGKWLDISKYRK